MNTLSPCQLFAATAAVAMTGLASVVSADDVVVPNDWATVEGSSFLGSPLHLSPFGGQGSARYQQAYHAGQFDGVPGVMLVEAIVFRPDADHGHSYTPTTYADVQLHLSTTTVNPWNLSSFYEANVGADETLVFSGPLTLSCAAVSLPDGTMDFDIVITLDTPFRYDPEAGHLLIDLVNPHDTTETFWDYEPSASGAVGSLLGEADAETANWVSHSGGYVTRIVYGPVPCPSDVNADRLVGFTDLLAVLSSWGCTSCAEDIDGSGAVDFGDLLTVLAAWGPCP